MTWSQLSGSRTRRGLIAWVLLWSGVIYSARPTLLAWGWRDWHLLTNNITPPLKSITTKYYSARVWVVYTVLVGKIWRRDKGSCCNVNCASSSWGCGSMSHRRPCQNLWGLRMESFDAGLASIWELLSSIQSVWSHGFESMMKGRSWKVAGWKRKKKREKKKCGRWDSPQTAQEVIISWKKKIYPHVEAVEHLNGKSWFTGHRGQMGSARGWYTIVSD